jgi:hypothetical protein
MTTGKDKDEEDQLDGVAEAADNPSEDDDEAAKEQVDSKAKGFSKSRADKKKDDETDEDQPSSKKGQGSGK